MAEEIEKQSNLYIETDKRFAPYLLAASFHGLLSFKGHYTQNSILHWIFSPKVRALKLIEQFQVKTDPHIPAQDIFAAIETFWEKIASYKKLS